MGIRGKDGGRIVVVGLRQVIPAKTLLAIPPGYSTTRMQPYITLPLIFTSCWSSNQMVGSIDTVGEANDNGLMEFTIELYKCESIDVRVEKWTDWSEVERATDGGPLV